MRNGMLARACLLVFLTAGCGLIAPPPRPDPELLGCYHLETNLPESYSDSLSYRLPAVIGLDYRNDGRWLVYPTVEEMQPTWGVRDGLPSGHVRREVGLGNTPITKWDSVLTVPADSIDIHFPGFGGTLVMRVGPHPQGLQGRAEWVIHQHISFMNEGVFVMLKPTSCDGLPPRLERTKRRGLFERGIAPDTGRTGALGNSTGDSSTNLLSMPVSMGALRTVVDG